MIEEELSGLKIHSEKSRIANPAYHADFKSCVMGYRADFKFCVSNNLNLIS